MARWMVRCNCGNPHCPDMIEVTGYPCGCREARSVGLGFSDRLELQAKGLWRSCDGDGATKTPRPAPRANTYVSSYVPPPDRYPVGTIALCCTECGCKVQVRFDNCGCVETVILQQGNANGKCPKHAFKALHAGCKYDRKSITTASLWRCDYCEAAAVTRTHSSGRVEYWPVYINRTASAKCPKNHFAHLGSPYGQLETRPAGPAAPGTIGWLSRKRKK